MRNLARIHTLSGKLVSLVERIRYTAARKSHFVAISAMVESARFGENGQDLKTVAENIRTLSGQITSLQETMQIQANDLAEISKLIISKNTNSNLIKRGK